MPASLTHHFLGQEVLKKCPFINNVNAFDLGCQGPDLFFYGFSLYKIGSEFHKTLIDKPLTLMLKYCNMQNEDTQELLFSYICGYITHHSTDSTTHPFIFYLQAVLQEQRQLTGKYSFSLHREIETEIDIIVARRYLKEKIYRFKPYKCFETGEVVKNEVSKMYSFVLSELYEKFYSFKEIRRCFNRFGLAMRLAYSPYGFKKHFVAFFETLFRTSNNYSALFYTLKQKNSTDVINEQKNEWFNPFCKAHRSFASFFELYESALLLAVKRIEHLKKDRLMPTDLLDNINMDTGLKI
jgi:hypothetical protein